MTITLRVREEMDLGMDDDDDDQITMERGHRENCILTWVQLGILLWEKEREKVWEKEKSERRGRLGTTGNWPDCFKRARSCSPACVRCDRRLLVNSFLGININLLLLPGWRVEKPLHSRYHPSVWNTMKSKCLYWTLYHYRILTQWSLFLEYPFFCFIFFLTSL